MSIGASTVNVNPLRQTLDAALASGMPVQISAVTNGRRYRYEHHYPALRIARIVDERRIGAVVVTDDLRRIKVSEIVAVSVAIPEGGRL